MTSPSVAKALRLSIAQILLESVQFKHRSDFLERTEEKAPPGEANLTVNVKVDEKSSSAVVQLQIDCDVPEAFYLYNASYIVVFRFDGERPEDFSERLAVTGANILHPYLRELISNLTGRGRFGPIVLNPINFEKAIKDQAVAAKAALTP